MNVWTIQPRCSNCRARLTLDDYREHKFSCSRSRGWSEIALLPRRDPGRSIRRPWLAKWPTERRQEKKVKSTTWHVLPPYKITHVLDRIAIFNDSDRNAHVEVTLAGEVIVRPMDFGRLSIAYLRVGDE